MNINNIPYIFIYVPQSVVLSREKACIIARRAGRELEIVTAGTTALAAVKEEDSALPLEGEDTQADEGDPDDGTMRQGVLAGSPLQGGIVTDLKLAEGMFHKILEGILPRRLFYKPVVACARPAYMTDQQAGVLGTAISMGAGARYVSMIKKPFQECRRVLEENPDACDILIGLMHAEGFEEEFTPTLEGIDYPWKNPFLAARIRAKGEVPRYIGEIRFRGTRVNIDRMVGWIREKAAKEVGRETEDWKMVVSCRQIEDFLQFPADYSDLKDENHTETYVRLLGTPDENVEEVASLVDAICDIFIEQAAYHFKKIEIKGYLYSSDSAISYISVNLDPEAKDHLLEVVGPRCRHCGRLIDPFASYVVSPSRYDGELYCSQACAKKGKGRA